LTAIQSQQPNEAICSGLSRQELSTLQALVIFIYHLLVCDVSSRTCYCICKSLNADCASRSVRRLSDWPHILLHGQHVVFVLLTYPIHVSIQFLMAHLLDRVIGTWVSSINGMLLPIFFSSSTVGFADYRQTLLCLCQIGRLHQHDDR